MKLSVLSKIRKEDLARSGELPKWIDSLLGPLNQFMEQVSAVLTNRVTFTDNISCKIITASFTHAVETELTLNTSQRVSGVFPIEVSGGVVRMDSWTFRRKADKRIGITAGLIGGTRADCTFIVLLG